MERLEAVQAEGPRRMALEDDLLLNRIDRRNVEIAAGDLQGDGGKTAARADVEEAPGAADDLEEGEGIEEMLDCDLFVRGDCGQVDLPAPLLQLRSKGEECAP